MTNWLTVVAKVVSKTLFCCKNVSASHNFSAKNRIVFAIFQVDFNVMLAKNFAGLGGSVGCTVRLETRRSRVQPPPRSATFFRGD